MQLNFRHLQVVGMLCAMMCSASFGAQAESSITVPSYTAFCQPNPEGVQISKDQGVVDWNNGRESIVWYGVIRQPDKLKVKVALLLPAGQTVHLQMLIAGVRRSVTVHGDASPVTADFGSYTIPAPSTYKFVLTGISRTGATFGNPQSLELSGPAVRESHFSTSPNGACPSVHLWYKYPTGSKITRFYNEVTVRRTPLWSYYMACGFSRGYFGIQVNSPTERRIIFSVWDSGSQPIHRSLVAADNRVTLVANGKGVFVGGFGNEGTGLHSHLVYHWHKNETYKFMVTAQPEGEFTVYSGYFYFPERGKWGLIASFRAPHDGGYLRGLYSFNEDFNGVNGYEERLAEFGPQWITTTTSPWEELTTAHFTFTNNGLKDRLDRGSGVTGDRFYLLNGGFMPETSYYQQELNRAASGTPPDVTLPLTPVQTAH